jgi:outer membrane protein assembly factor BamB
VNRAARIVVTGSRRWTDAAVLREVLDNLANAVHADGFTELRVAHGKCYPAVDPETGRRPAKSADWLAHLWIELLPHPLTVVEEAHPADWDAPCRRTCRKDHRRPNKGRPGTYCPTAGNYRNADKLVAPGADAAAVFLLDESSGTTDCMRRLVAAEIPFTPIVRRSDLAAQVPLTLPDNSKETR